MTSRLASAAVAALLLLPLPAFAQGMGQPRESIQFLDAIRKQDGNKVNEFLRDKASSLINVKDPYGTGESALHIVVKRQDPTYLSVLINQPGVNVNIQDREGNTPLLFAASLGWGAGVDALIAKKANVNLANNGGVTPLIRAVLAHDSEVVKKLLDAGADPDRADFGGGLSAREYAARETRYPTIAKLLADAPKVGRAAAAAGPKL
ncbi:ankyrin repeat domain-containing protein [uncultured Sphingomonas sp.]|uniref:ankyrin repeat domain-containing protein n=1 Tax=uncultured Sphingomonas sp. TaxID=158754 RepID=UPI002600F0DE|nr:ankyrin repeat domain-containing protein [uncultured Sphingomonas sp.]